MPFSQGLILNCPQREHDKGPKGAPHFTHLWNELKDQT